MFRLCFARVSNGHAHDEGGGDASLLLALIYVIGKTARFNSARKHAIFGHFSSRRASASDDCRGGRHGDDKASGMAASVVSGVVAGTVSTPVIRGSKRYWLAL